MVRPLQRAAALGASLLVLAAGVTCTEGPTGPKSVYALVGLTPQFSKAATEIYRNLVSFQLEIDNVHVRLERANGDLVLDTVVVLAPGQQEIVLQLKVELEGTQEEFEALIELRDGDQVLFSGTQTVTARAGGTSTPPPPIVIEYTGPGATVATLEVDPDTTISGIDDITMRVVGRDAGNQVVSNLNLAWSINNPALGTLTDVGVFQPTGSRGTALITAELPTGISGFATVIIAPPPTGVALISGGGQTSTVGSVLGLPIIAEVQAADGGPVAGHTVSFAVTAGGGSVQPANAVTGADGRASFLLTLGPTPGTNSVQITAADLPPISVSATATVGQAAKLGMVQQPSANAVSAVQLPTQPSVQVQDAFGNAVATADLTVTAQLTTADGRALQGTTTATTNSSGLALFSDLRISGPAGTATLTFTQGSLTPVTSTAIALSTGVPASMSATNALTMTDSAGANVAAAQLPSVIVRNASSNPLSGVEVKFRRHGGAGATINALPDTMVLALTDANGVAALTGRRLQTLVGFDTVLVTAAGLTDTLRYIATVTHANATTLAYVQQPPNGTTGVVLSPAPTADVRDQFGNRVTTGSGSTVSVSVSLIDGTLSGSTSSPAVAGIATFNALTVMSPGSAHRLVAAATGLTSATSNTFAISAPTSGTTRTWLNAVDGSWETAGNWSGGVVPGPADTALINLAGEYTVSISSAVTVGKVVVGTDVPTGLQGFAVAIPGASLTVGDSLRVRPSGGLILLGTPGTTALSGGRIVIAGVAQWLGGDIVGSEPIVVEASGTLLMSAANGITLGRTLQNHGTTFVVGSGAAGTLTLTNGASIENSGQFHAQQVWTLVQGAGSTGSFINSGTFQRVVGDAGTTTIGVPYSNSGTTEIHQGILQFTGTTLTNTATGVMRGTGSFDVGAVTFTNAGTVAPGLSAGELEIFGTLPMQGTSRVAIELGGVAQASEYDFLSVDGPVSLGGTLEISLINGFQPQVGQTFTIMEFSSSTGNFGTITGLDLGGGLTLVPTFNSSNLVLEVQEASPATISWVNPSDGNWSVGSNWSTGVVPTSSDIVGIELAGTYTVTLDVTPPTLAGLILGGTSGVQTLTGTGINLPFNGTLNVRTNGVLSLSSANLAGTGTALNEGTLQLTGMSVFASTILDNRGTLILRGTTLINGQLLTTPSSIIYVEGSSASAAAQVTVAAGFTNSGLLEFRSVVQAFAANLTVSTGTLTNAPGAFIISSPGTGEGGGRQLTAQLDNQGALIVAWPMNIGQTGAAQVNNGSIDVARDLTLSATSGSFVNNNSISISAGRAMLLSGGSIDLTPGIVTGDPTGRLVLSNATLTFTPEDVLIPLTLSNTTVAGGAITVADGQTLRLYSTVVNAAVAVQGGGTLITLGSVSVPLTGALTVAANGVVSIRGQTNGGGANLTVANGFINNGTIELTSFVDVFSSQLTVTNGTLTNSTTGAIRSLPGSGGARTLAVALVNQGVLEVDHPLTMNRASSDHTNSGTIDLTAADLTINQSVTTPSFTNSGIIDIGAGRTFLVTGGTLSNNSGGTIRGTGTMNVSATTFTNAGSIAPGGAGTAATLTVTGAYAQSASGALSIELGGTSQNDVLIVSGAATLSGTLNVTLLNSFAPVEGNSFTILNYASLTGEFASLNLPGLSAGLEWSTSYGSTALTLTVLASGAPTVSWINAAGGNWSVGANWSTGTPPTSSDNVAVDLAGTYTVTLDQSATIAQLQFGAASGVQTLAIAGGGTVLTITNAGQFTSNTVLQLSGGALSGAGQVVTSGTFAWSGGALGSSGAAGTLTVAAGGTLSMTGTRTLQQNYTLAIAGVGMWSTGTINGGTGGVLNILSGGSLEIQGDDALVHSLGGTAPAINNAGTLSRTTSTGTATIQGVFTNTGSVQVTNGTLLLAEGTWSGAANLTVASGATLSFGGGTIGGALSGAGTVAFTSGTTTLTGTYTLGATDISGSATVVFNTSATATTGTLTETIGTIDGNATLSVTSAFNWNGGALGATGLTGQVRVEPTATVTIATTLTKTLQQNFTLTIAGAGIWTAGQMNGGTGGVMNILSGGSLEIQGSVSLQNNLGGTAPALNNAGTLEISGANTFTFVGSFSHQVGAILRGTGTLDIASATATSFAGIVNPGTSPGILSITGPITQAATSISNIELGGVTAGSQYDRLTVSGATTLGGTLNVSLIEGFVPVVGNSFTILNYASHTGAFATTNLPGLSAGLEWSTSFGSTALTLTVVTSTTVNWINTAGGNWSEGANWSTGAVPTTSQSVVIQTAGTYTVTLDVGATVAGLTIGGASGVQTLSGVGQALTVIGPTSITATTGALSLTSSNMDGSGTVTNQGSLILENTATGSSTTINNQGLFIARSTTVLNGPLLTTAASTVRIEGITGPGDASVDVANGFINNGLVELTSTGERAATLTLLAGTLTNSSTAIVRSSVGQAGGARTLAAAIDNQGLLDVDQQLTLSGAGADHLNTGTIDLTSADLVIDQTGTTPSFTNSGTVTVGPARTLTVNGGTFTQSVSGVLDGGGTLTLNTLVAANFNTTFTLGALNVNSSTLNLGTGVNPSTSGLALNLFSTTVNGPGTFTNVAGQTLTLTGSNIAANSAITNDGTLLVSGGSQVDGTLAQGAGSIIRVQPDGATGFATLVVPNTGFANNTAIELTSLVNGFAQFTANSGGTFTNGTGGSITALAGSGGQRILGSVNNLGTITVERGENAGMLTVAGNLTTTGTLNVELGGTTPGSSYSQITVTNVLTAGGPLNVTLDGAFNPANGESFTILNYVSRSGEFDAINLPALDAGLEWVVSSGATSLTLTVQQIAVTWANAASGNWSTPANWSTGVVPGSGDRVAINLAGTYTVTMDVDVTIAELDLGGASGVQTLTAGTGRTFTVNGPTNIAANGVMSFTSSNIGGTGTITNEGSLVLQSTGLALETTLDNRGSFTALGSTTIAGPLVTSSSSSITVDGSAGGSLSTNGFTNEGTITLTSNGNPATLTVSSGTLTNAVGAVINSVTGSGGGSRILAAQLDNQGTLDVDQQLEINSAGAQHTNSGLIDVGLALTVTQSAEGSLTNTGTIQVQANRNFIVSGGSFTNSAGGDIQGAGGSTVNVSATTVVQDGQVTPTSIFNWTGDYAPSASSVLNIELRGTTAGLVDALAISGTATLAGTLNVSLGNGFAPALGNAFTVVMPTTARSGTFSQHTLPALNTGLAWEVDYTTHATHVILRVVNAP